MVYLPKSGVNVPNQVLKRFIGKFLFFFPYYCKNPRGLLLLLALLVNPFCELK